MRRILMLLIALSVAGVAWSDDDGKISSWEIQLMGSVVHYENLTREQAALLFAVRCQEDGAKSNSCGVEAPLAKMYRDRQFSALMQLRWTAWAIKERYDGNLDHFSVSYHNGDDASNRHWTAMVKKYMQQYEKMNPRWLK